MLLRRAAALRGRAHQIGHEIEEHADLRELRFPGALAIDWHGNVEDGALRSQVALTERYAEIDSEQTVVAYCKSGMRASLTFVVLQALGYADVRLYDGSWNEWGARPELPRER